MKKQLLILMTLFIAITGYSQTITDGNITYTITSANTVEVDSYNVAAGGTDVVIPAMIPVAAPTHSVTGIGILAFFNDGITSVDIPDGVTSILVGAFSGNSLTDVTIPDNVLNIGNGAFQNNSITNLVIGNSVTSIGNNAFTSNQLTSVTLGSDVLSIGTWAFQGNPLTCVISEATIPPTISSNNVATDSFGDRSNINLSIPAGTATAYTNATWTDFNSVAEGFSNVFIANNITYAITTSPNNEVSIIDYNTAGGSIVTIPTTVVSSCTSYSVTNIAISAFENKNLTQVTMPNSITSIGVEAFRNNLLTNVMLSDNTSIIGVRAFLSNQLSSVIIPDSVTDIGDGAFASNLLQSIIIPDNVTDIGDGTFASNQLSTVNLGNSLINIGDQAFLNNMITSLTMPNSIQDIGVRAFQSNQITSVTLSNNLTTIGEDSFRNNQITSVIIPDGVISIGPDAFQNNLITNLVLSNTVTSISTGAFDTNQLTVLTIPNSVVGMGNNVFRFNPLTDVYSESTTPSNITTGGALDTFAFNGVRSNIHLHIPAGTMGAYVTDVGALWTGFNPVTEDALSVSEFELANDIKVITTQDKIEVVSANGTILDNYTLYNISGAKIISGHQSDISTTALASGIYILKLDFNKGKVTKKVIVN